jgi:hydrogenase expression/formation protein HypD
LTNYSILSSHVLVPPAIETLMKDPENKIDGFLAAGHVCTIMGTSEYFPLSRKYNIPIIITGFEPVDILQAIFMIVRQLETKTSKVENQYSRMVKEEGNTNAKKVIFDVFGVSDRSWRGIGNIPDSGYVVREKYKSYDAENKFQLELKEVAENKKCIAGSIMKGKKKPF